MRKRFITLWGLIAILTVPLISQSREYFVIKAVDDQTGRGVPLVELQTTNNITYYSDSNGIVALDEPGLMGQTVYFYVKSDGYQFPKDFFGNRGVAVEVRRGGYVELKLRRVSIAERLYRVTGEGIYRDSVLAGAPVPVKQPVLNAQVMGQDGGLAIPYRGKIYWFWGDTTRPSYPLGNFAVSGATSALPASGGLDPGRGIDLSYFTDDSGFTRPMLPPAQFPGPGLKWIGGLKIISDAGKDRLIADYVRLKDLGHPYERGLAIFDDNTQSFERLAQFNADDPMVSFCWGGHPVRIKVLGVSYYYQNYIPPYLCRMRADLPHVKAPGSFEGFSPLAPGARYEKEASKLDRAADGHLRYAWKQNTPGLTPNQEQELIAAGKMKESERLFQLRNIDTGARVKPGPGSMQWNSFLKRWVMIVKEDEGLVNHGILWFSEADTPLGPWVYAKEILRHEKYNFYNPVQHSFFDQDGGRIIYFEGTYAGGPAIFAAGHELVPRYDYNQIMYRLVLDDLRLALPVPVYRVREANSPLRYLLRDQLDTKNAWANVEGIPFFAIPPDRSYAGLIPIFGEMNEHETNLRLHLTSSGASPLFYALPAVVQTPQPPQGPSGKWSCTAQLDKGEDVGPFRLDLRLDGETLTSATSGRNEKLRGTFKGREIKLTLEIEDDTYALTGGLQHGHLGGSWQSQKDTSAHGTWSCKRTPVMRAPESPAIVPLYEYEDTSNGSFLYSTDGGLAGKTLRRSPQPLCRVWRNPASQLILDPFAKPVLDDAPQGAQ